MLKIYGVPISVHTRKVIIAARLKRLRYELIPVVPVLPDSLPANWHALSPTGMVPALEDGEFILADSAAICGYLERRWPESPLYPPDAQGYGRTVWLEQYAGGSLFADVVRPLFHEVFVHPRVRGIATDADVVGDVVSRRMPEILEYLDSVSGPEFLTGSALTVADLAVMSNLITLQYIGFGLDRVRFPRLAALLDRVVRVPEVTAALRSEIPAVQQMGLDGSCLRALLT